MPLDADDISVLYERHARALVRFFARRTYDPQVAVELAAETFAAAAADRRAFRGAGAEDEAATAWLYGIARHQLSAWYRHARVERRALAQWRLEAPALEDAEYERVDELAGLGELRARVAAALDALPERDRDALRLRVVEERPYPEVAATLGIGEQAARKRVSRALRQLAEQVRVTGPVGPVLAREVGEHGTA